METPNGEAEGPPNTNDHGKDDGLDDKTVMNGNLMSDEHLEATGSKFAGFWSSELKSTRKQVCTKWARTVFIMAAYIVAVLSLYWGSLYGILENLSALKVWVVDFDAQLSPYNNTTPFVGPIVQEYFRSLQAEGGSTLGWTVVSPAEFNYDPIAVRQSIYDEDAYVAIMVNANATALLQEAVNTGNQDYDPTGAIHVIYNTARDQTTVASDIVPRLLATLFPVTALIGERWVAMLAQNASNQNVWKVPQAINPAVGLTLIDLRPFNPPVVTPSVSVGLIYLTILSFFNYPFLAPIHAAFMRGKHRPLHPVQLAIWRLLSSFMTYFVLSLCYSLISLAFQVPFSNSPVPGTVSAANPNAYGRGSFVVYWMLNFVAMGSLGLPSENMAMILGQPWAAFWLIFWVITNVSTSFSPIILAPGFYKWGYAWPMHRIVEASRTILFGTYSRIGLDFGVLFAWIAVSIAFYPVAIYVEGRRMRKMMKNS